MISSKPIFDTHFHLYQEDNQQQIITDAHKENVKILMNIGTDLASSKQAQKIASSFKNVYFSAGVHPCHTEEFDNNYDTFKKLLQDPKCRAVGEIGLDYHYPHDKHHQQQIFANFLDIAHQLKKPPVIHCRDAFQDCLTLLEKHLKKETPFILHCYTGNIEWAKKIIDLGGYISYSGIITFKNKTQEIQDSLTVIPRNRILLETDAPYLAPTPHRGKRNQPAYIIHTLEKMATLLQLTYDETADLTRQNACQLLGVNDVI